jgi:hypothetical protein
MEDREFNEIDLRRMLQYALGYRPDILEGRFVIEARHSVKIVLFKWFSAELSKNGVNGPVPDEQESDVSQVYAGQIVNHLAGDVFDPFDERASEAVRRFALHINEETPEIADNLMKQDRNLRELIVQTLRMRLILGSSKDENFQKTTQGKHIGLLLRQYGPECSEQVDEKRYSALVNTLMAWSRSEAFPGKDVQT